MTKDMTQGSPLKLLLAFAVPLMLGSLFQQFYNLADTIIVGRFVGVEALAAVGSVGGLNYLVLGFVNGIACGFSIPISWTFGAHDHHEMRRYTANTVWLSIAFATVLTIVTVAMTHLVLVWTNTPADIIDLADIYIRTIFAGIPFTLLYNVTSALMRALGDSKRPLYFLLVASVLNIGLDLACIILFNMGVFGAAFATVFSQAVAGIGSLIYIMRHYPELRWNKEEGRISAPHCAKLCAMGLPMGLQCSITAIGSVVLQGAVNGLGSDIVAAQTAGGKAAQFLSVPLESIGTAGWLTGLICDGIIAGVGAVIGFVPQMDLMRGSDSVFRTLMDAASLRLPKDFTGAERKARVEDVMKIFGLTPVENHMVAKLSGGQRRRIDVARALFHSPDILILDEPTTGLDPQTRRTLWEVVQSLRRRNGMTVFLTTHYIFEAESLCDRIGMIMKGKLVAEGTPEELIESVGRFAMVRTDEDDETTISFYPDRHAAKAAADEFTGEHNTVVRRTTLEDVFLEITGGPR